MLKRRRNIAAISRVTFLAIGSVLACPFSESVFAQTTISATGDGYISASGGTLYYSAPGYQIPVGQNAIAVSEPTGDDPENASAGAFAVGGPGLTPGNASASATAANSTSDSDASASATAIGGDSAWPDPPTGAGGNGGNADVQATATADNSTHPNATAYAYADAAGGGIGGLGEDIDGSLGYVVGSGGNGGIATIDAPVTATSNYGGNVSATAIAYAGEGGPVAPGGGTPEYPEEAPYGESPQPGSSASASLINMVSASSTTIAEPAGEGGGSTGGSGQITLDQETYGGDGGDDPFSAGSSGSSGTSSLTTEGGPNVTATTIANGGNGGWGGGGYFVDGSGNLYPAIGGGGNGGAATAYTELDGGGVANATASGGYGGVSYGSTPGQGGNAVAAAESDANTAGIPCTANATAYGGAGGYFYASAGVASGFGGAGGSANATAMALPFSGMATGSASAYGGDGGPGDGAGGTGGTGGSATAAVEATGIFDDVLLNAYAQGGAGGDAYDGSSNGVGGSATAIIWAQPQGEIEQYSPGLADGQGGTASLSVGNNTITISSPGQPTSNNGSLTITFPGTLTLNQITGSGSLTVGDGTNDTTLLLNTADGVSNSLGSFTVNAYSALDLFTDASGTLAVGTGSTNNGQMNVTGSGSTTIGGVSGTGSLTIGDGTNPTVLHFSTNSGASSQSSLTINAGSALDIGNNHLILNDPGGGIDSMIEAYLAAGYNGGGWNGTSATGGSITTSAPTGTTYGIGWADGATGGISGLNSGQLEIKYTFYGDTNLDGVVNSVDFGTLAANFGTSGPDIGWAQGAFTYNNTVNSVDFGLLAANFGKSASGADVVTAADWAALDAFAEVNGLMAEVPEPNSTLVLLVGTALVAKRRRRCSST